jgi:hypothetical protein
MPASVAFRLSGGTGNTNPAAALGGAISTTAVAANTLFDTVSAGEAGSGDTEYRCFYVLNDGDEVLDSVKVWISDQPTQGTYALALGGEGIDGTAETVANESTAPTGESFSSPVTALTGLECGPLNPGQRRPVWARRVIGAATPGVSLAGNPAQFRVDYEYVPG